MAEELWISDVAVCEYYQVEHSFISSLEEFGLIEIDQRENQRLIARDQLAEIEKYIHLHYDLNINMEGIDAIHHLLDRLQSLSKEMNMLRNRLRIYETD